MNGLTAVFIGLITIASIPKIAVANPSQVTTATSKLSPAKWTLLWSDEFSGTTLNDHIWTRVKRGTSPWNDTMSDDPSLLSVGDGMLTLRGIANQRQKTDPAPYLTAGVTSKGKFTVRYGKVQVRARFKSAQGAWPALWMLGAEKKWPAKGEIDLMEHLNFDDIVYQTVHSEYTVKIDQTDTPKRVETTPIQRDDWNIYGCEWDAHKIVFTVNGQPTHTYPRVPEKGPQQWPFDQPFYFVFSMQIGGPWVNGSGATNPEHYPIDMDVDWVRVYRLGQGGTTAVQPGPVLPTVK